MKTLQEFEEFYKTSGDVPQTHRVIYDTFTDLVNADSELKEHRDYIEAHGLGMGARYFHHLWRLIVESLPNDFAMLELGIHAGQCVSLWQMLAKRTGKNANIVGVSVFDGTEMGNHFTDYRPIVLDLFDHFNLNHPVLIKGDSTKEETIQEAAKHSPYDCVFVDGTHTPKGVLSDITRYGPMVKIGGLLVTDDSANRMNMPPSTPTHHFFQGIEEVSQAVDSLMPPLASGVLPDGSRWEQVAVCIHDRVFRRIG